MSTPDRPSLDEHEWQAQERALQAARGRAANGSDPTAAHYRIVAEALISLPRSGPPSDFAAAVTECIARYDAGWEGRLSRILLAVLAIASIAMGALYGEQWWRPFRQTLGDDALGWVLAGAGCVMLSWVFGRLRALAGRSASPGHAP